MHTTTASSIFSIMPDYVLPYAIHLLAHDPDYSSYKDISALKSIKEYVCACGPACVCVCVRACVRAFVYVLLNLPHDYHSCLSFLLDALMTRSSTVPVSFYQRMVTSIKNTEDAQYPDNAPQADKDEANKVAVVWCAVLYCDVVYCAVCNELRCVMVCCV